MTSDGLVITSFIDYCTIPFNSTLTCDCDTLGHFDTSTLWAVTRDKIKISTLFSVCCDNIPGHLQCFSSPSSLTTVQYIDPVTTLPSNRDPFLSPPFLSQSQSSQSSVQIFFVSLSVLHTSAPLANLGAHLVVQCGHLCEVARRARACKAGRVHLSSGSV
jgi:hypothetical protein